MGVGVTHGTFWGGQGARHLPPGGSEAEKSNLMFSLEILGVGGRERLQMTWLRHKPFPPPFSSDRSVFSQVLPPIIPGGHKGTGPGNQKPESRHATLTVFTESKIIIYRKRNIELIDF